MSTNEQMAAAIKDMTDVRKYFDRVSTRYAAKIRELTRQKDHGELTSAYGEETAALVALAYETELPRLERAAEIASSGLDNVISYLEHRLVTLQQASAGKTKKAQPACMVTPSGAKIIVRTEEKK